MLVRFYGKHSRISYIYSFTETSMFECVFYYKGGVRKIHNKRVPLCLLADVQVI